MKKHGDKMLSTKFSNASVIQNKQSSSKYLFVKGILTYEYAGFNITRKLTNYKSSFKQRCSVQCAHFRRLNAFHTI